MALILVVWDATSAAVIYPMHKMPVRRAGFARGSRWSAKPIMATMAVFITKIANATVFGHFHDRVVFRY
jgi:hypothetical protein